MYSFMILMFLKMKVVLYKLIPTKENMSFYDLYQMVSSGYFKRDYNLPNVYI